MFITFRSKIKYSPESSLCIGEQASAQRQAYNMAIDIVLQHPNITKFDLYKKWTQIRSENSQIASYPLLLQRPGLARAHDAVKKFHTAQAKYIDSKNYKKEPRINPDTQRLYRSRKHHKSILVIHDKNAIRLINTNRFMLAGKGQILELCRPVPPDATVRTINIIERTKHMKRNMRLEKKTYTAFITLEIEDPIPIEPVSDDLAGYDLGIANIVTTDDEQHYNNPSKERIETIVDIANQISHRMANCKRGSVTWRKLRRKKLCLYKEQNTLCHIFELATAKDIAQKGTAIAADGVLPKNLMASPRGTLENPGKNVQAKKGLNRKLAIVRFGKLRDKINWECKKIGKIHRRVYAKNGSITCHGCGHVDKKSRKSQAEFVCTSCGLSFNADHNAACVHVIRLRKLLFGTDKVTSVPAAGITSLNGKRKSSSAQMAFSFVWS